MKISEQWLRKWSNPALDSKALQDCLTMAGLEVEGSEPVAGNFSQVVVAEVQTVQPHPNADRLRVCQVNIGAEIVQIVCGASNVAAGLKVPAALLGAKIGADLVIKASKLRGIESFGMLCSAVELGLAEESDGLLILPSDAPVGMDIREYLQLNDAVIEISLTPNRGDCLSIMGIAREVATLTGANYTPELCTPVAPTITDRMAIAIDAPHACPRYAGRIIKGINPAALIPLWMSECLRRAGIRCIQPVVDIINYVMLELGQPMHAFDLTTINQEIRIRNAKPQEQLTLLDNKTISLNEKTLVIADANQALAMAGIMGGLASAVTAQTTNLFIESAFFVPTEMAGKARYYGLRTDSSHRFERGVDPCLSTTAIERATALILDIAGGDAGPIEVVSHDANLPEPKFILLRHQRIERLLGEKIDSTWLEQTLSRLGLHLTQVSTQSDQVWQVTVPSYRFDLHQEADLIEEIARLYGYNNIPAILPQTHLTAQRRSESSLSLRQLRHTLAARDYCEAITYSFVAPALQALLDPTNTPRCLVNPISPELSAMRTSLWQGLITAYLYNQARQANRVRLFETGLRFVSQDEKLLQQPMLAGLCAGATFSEQWASPDKEIDFFDIKNDVEALFALRHDKADIRFVPTQIAALHPGRSAEIFVGDQFMGYIGALHPKIAEELDIRQAIYLFELQLDSFLAAQLPQFATLSKYPSVRRDIAVVIDQSVSVASVQQTIVDVCKDWLVDWQLFDVYQGKGIAEGYRSLAFGFTLQHPARTLTEAEISEIMNQLIVELRQRFNAVLRE